MISQTVREDAYVCGRSLNNVDLAPMRLFGTSDFEEVFHIYQPSTHRTCFRVGKRANHEMSEIPHY